MYELGEEIAEILEHWFFVHFLFFVHFVPIEDWIAQDAPLNITIFINMHHLNIEIIIVIEKSKTVVLYIELWLRFNIDYLNNNL